MDTRVTKIARERFVSTDNDAREALRNAIAEISDDQLLSTRETHIIVMA
jgi:hypothetical protein